MQKWEKSGGVLSNRCGYLPYDAVDAAFGGTILK